MATTWMHAYCFKCGKRTKKYETGNPLMFKSKTTIAGWRWRLDNLMGTKVEVPHCPKCWKKIMAKVTAELIKEEEINELPPMIDKINELILDKRKRRKTK